MNEYQIYSTDRAEGVRPRGQPVKLTYKKECGSTY